MLEQINVVRTSDLAVEIDNAIESVVYDFILDNPEEDEDIFFDIDERDHVYDLYTKEEINSAIASLKKKKRKEFLTVMDTYHTFVNQIGLEIDRNYYNLIAFCSDLKSGEKNIEDYV